MVLIDPRPDKFLNDICDGKGFLIQEAIDFIKNTNRRWGETYGNHEKVKSLVSESGVMLHKIISDNAFKSDQLFDISSDVGKGIHNLLANHEYKVILLIGEIGDIYL